MSLFNWDRCDCICHRIGTKKHAIPCCAPCPICGARVKISQTERHFTFCQREIEHEVLAKITPRVKAAWCEWTCSPADLKRWTPFNPCIGQSAVTALLIQDLMKGDIMRTAVKKYGSHYYNRLPSGDVLDLTSGQYPEGTEIPPGEPHARLYILDSPRAINARTRQRYELLSERYVTCRPKRD